MMKLQILETLKTSDFLTRFFKVNIFARQTSNVVQFNSGGDDYNPPQNCEGLGDIIGNTPNNGFVCAWRDFTPRVALPGEKRLYAVNPADKTIVGELHLKNDGTILLKGNKLSLDFSTIESKGAWTHTGNIGVGGNVTASHIEAADGATGVLDKPQVSKGIVTGGS